MKLVLVRHGRPDEDDARRPHDPPLRADGWAHGLPINLVLSHALGLSRITHFHPGCGSITRLRMRAGGALGVVSIKESGQHARPPATPRLLPVAQPAAAERTGP